MHRSGENLKPKNAHLKNCEMNDTMRVNMSVSDFVYFFTGSLKIHSSWFKEKFHQAFLCLIIILDRLTCAYVIEMRVHIHVGACDRN